MGGSLGIEVTAFGASTKVLYVRPRFLTADAVLRINMYRNATFHADWCSRCRDMADFQFFKMAAVRHLRLLEVQNFNCQYPLES